MTTILGLLLLFLGVGLFTRKYDNRTRLLLSALIVGMLLLSYLIPTSVPICLGDPGAQSGTISSGVGASCNGNP
jgi:hypothetical protein